MDIFEDVKGLPRVINPERVPLKMMTGYGYSTRTGVEFSREHPFQLVEPGEAMELLDTGRFALATPEEIKEFYKR